MGEESYFFLPIQARIIIVAQMIAVIITNVGILTTSKNGIKKAP